jgi:DNA-directed RNA polymerase specialized sigma24 family protein
MRDDGDFATYLAARWTPVVRTLVMLGCPQPVAEDVARSAFARLSTAWGSVQDSEDIDAQAYGVVLKEWRRARTRGVGGDARGDEPPAAPPRVRLEAMLDRLTPDLRAMLLLRFVADLSDAQVADVMELSVTATRERLAAGLQAIDLEALREASR